MNKIDISWNITNITLQALNVHSEVTIRVKLEVHLKVYCVNHLY